jgi:predicted ester cyclase
MVLQRGSRAVLAARAISHIGVSWRETPGKRRSLHAPSRAMALHKTKDFKMSNATETVKAFVTEVFDAKGINVDKIENHFAPDCVFHDAMPGMEGVEGYKNLMRMFDAGTEPIEGATQPIIIGEGEIAAVRWINKLKHTGDLMGVPATGKVAVAKGHEIYRVKDGKIVENWAVMDVAGIMAQLTGS